MFVLFVVLHVASAQSKAVYVNQLHYGDKKESNKITKMKVNMPIIQTSSCLIVCILFAAHKLKCFAVSDNYRED